MLKIWGRENSTNVKKARWCAAELGLAYELVPAGGQFGRNHDADYLSMNPNGLVPCLQDDDLVLWESHAIVRYLAAQYGQGRFLSCQCENSGWHRQMAGLGGRVLRALQTGIHQSDPHSAGQA
ncbi:hypothetical protein DZS_40800 [Dickeya ananatis]